MKTKCELLLHRWYLHIYILNSVMAEPTSVLLQTLNSTSIKVSWTPPTTASTKIIAYSISYYQAIKDAYQTIPSFTSISPSVIVRVGPVNETIINHLSASSYYVVQVAAVTVDGVGLYSLPTNIATDAKGWCTNMRVFKIISCIFYLNFFRDKPSIVINFIQ